jgi:dUTP pyrophosphatase
MEQRKILESAIERLKELDRRLSDDEPEEVEVMEELNNILNGLKVTQLDVVKSSINPVLKFVNESPNPDPTFANEGDSGFDLRAYLQDDIEYHVEPWKGVIVPTGLYFEVEKGLEIQVRPRSGLAAKYWVTVLNTPGTVDSRYRGEIQIIFMNLSDDKFIIKNGDRIAQGVVCPVYGEGKLNMNKVEKLSESDRGTKGFGSTGYK